MKKYICDMTVRQVLVLFYSIVIVIFLCLLFWGFLGQRRNMQEQNSVGFENLSASITRSVTDKCELYNNMLTKIAYNDMVQEWMERDPSEYDAENRGQLTEHLKNYISLDDTIVDAALFGSNGRQMNISGDILEIRKASEEIPEKVPCYYTGMKTINVSLMYPKMRECIIMGARVYSKTTFDRENPIGTAVLVLDVEKLLNLESEKGLEGAEQLLYDRDHEVFCNSPGFSREGISWDEIGGQLEAGREWLDLDGKSYAVKTSSIPWLEGQIVLIVSEDELMRDVNELTRNQILLLLLAGILILPLFFGSIRWIAGPINRLAEFFSVNSQNGITALKHQVKPDGPREIRVLGNNINGMLQEMNQITHRLVHTTMRLYEAEMAKKTAELKYLYAQINPHFLFNTIEVIKGCTVEEDAWKSYRMLDALGKIFRYSVTVADEVPLKEEVRLVRNYFYIHKMRFGGKLDYEIRIPEEMMEYQIPKMILQPLVENAVVHGVEASENGGRILLEGSMEKGCLTLTVSNTGNWIPGEKMEGFPETA